MKYARALVFAALAGLTIVTTGCSVARNQETVGAYIDDTGITTAIKAKMAEDKTVSAAAISVETLNGTLLVEQKVPVGHVTGEEGATGTGDGIIIVSDFSELQAHDLKYGMGVEVDADDNTQMKLYALGTFTSVPGYGRGGIAAMAIGNACGSALPMSSLALITILLARNRTSSPPSNMRASQYIAASGSLPRQLLIKAEMVS